MSRNYETQKDEEAIYFAYERFGDFFIADDILSKFQTQADVISAFEKNGEQAMQPLVLVACRTISGSSWIEECQSQLRVHRHF